MSGALVKVSVIIPLYNARDVIRETIESVLAQTWTDYEIVVVDEVRNEATRPIATGVEPILALEPVVLHQNQPNPFQVFVAVETEPSGSAIGCHQAVSRLPRTQRLGRKTG